jgi:hypothetical protein
LNAAYRNSSLSRDANTEYYEGVGANTPAQARGLLALGRSSRARAWRPRLRWAEWAVVSFSFF